MKPVVDEVAKKLRDALKKNVTDFEGLYVFGSQVRGDATDDSDVDIVVLFSQEYSRPPRAFSDVMSQMYYDYFEIIDLDVLPYSRDELKRNISLHDEVVNKGIFYGA